MIGSKIVRPLDTQLILIAMLLCIAVSDAALAQNNEQNTLRLAAYEGNPEAQFKLALSYSQKVSPPNSGSFKKPNFPLSAYWYTQAARQGMANAQYNLGHYYLQGLGVKQDTAKTIQWWKQSAHQNYLPAQHNIGTAYFEGIGVKQNSQLAVLWFERCAELGSDTCANSLITAKENMTIPADIPAEKLDAKTDVKTIETIKTIDSDAGNKEIDDKIDIPVHIQANSDSTVITRLTDNTDFQLLSGDGSLDDPSNQGWQQIQLNKPIKVWCYKSFVAIDEQTATFTGDKVRARTEPSTKTGIVIKELAKGTELLVLQEKEKWVQLALTNHTAWIEVKQAKQIIAKNTENTLNSAEDSAVNAEGSIINNAEDSAVNAEGSQVVADLANDKLATSSDIKIEAPQKLTFDYSFIDQRSDDDWLFKSNPEQFTLLLSSFDSGKQLTEFAAKAQLTDKQELRILLAKRGSIEWKYALYGNFKNQQQALQAATQKGFTRAYIERIGNIQEQRCSAWKTTIPSPKKLPIYCLKKTAFSS